MTDDALQIQSFRVVFDLERRIHRIDRFKIPLPYGLPLRSLGYGITALIAMVLVSSVPVIGAPIAALPSPIRLVIIPVGAAMLLTRLRIDGRSAHAACEAWLRFQLQPRCLVAFDRSIGSQTVRLGDLCVVEPASNRKRPGRRRFRGCPSAPKLRGRLRGTEQLKLIADNQLELW